MKFLSEMFDGWEKWENPTDTPTVAAVVADMAQAAFDAWLMEQPEIVRHGAIWFEISRQPMSEIPPTHIARLVDVKKIGEEAD